MRVCVCVCVCVRARSFVYVRMCVYVVLSVFCFTKLSQITFMSRCWCFCNCAMLSTVMAVVMLVKPVVPAVVDVVLVAECPLSDAANGSLVTPRVGFHPEGVAITEPHTSWTRLYDPADWYGTTRTSLQQQPQHFR